MIKLYFSPHFFFPRYRIPILTKSNIFYTGEGKIRSHYAITNLSLTGHLKYKGMLEGGNFRSVNYSHTHRVLNKKKRLIKNSPSLESHKKGVIPNKSDNF